MTAALEQLVATPEDRIETAVRIVRAEAMRFFPPKDPKSNAEVVTPLDPVVEEAVRISASRLGIVLPKNLKDYHNDDWLDDRMWFEACRALIVCAIEDVVEAVELDAEAKFVGRIAMARARFAHQKLAACWGDDILSIFAGYLPTTTSKTTAKANGSSSLSALTALIYAEATGEIGKVGHEDSVVRKAVLAYVRDVKQQWPWLASRPKRRSMSQALIEAIEPTREGDLRRQERDERWLQPTVASRLAEVMSLSSLGNRFQIEWGELWRRYRDESKAPPHPPRLVTKKIPRRRRRAAISSDMV